MSFRETLVLEHSMQPSAAHLCRHAHFIFQQGLVLTNIAKNPTSVFIDCSIPPSDPSELKSTEYGVCCLKKRKQISFIPDCISAAIHEDKSPLLRRATFLLLPFRWS